MPKRILLAVLLLLPGATSLAAQTGPVPEMRSSAARSPSCVVAASVAGGGAGMFLGGVIGYRIERAFYRSNEDAGVTGLTVGAIAGAIAGIRVARMACDRSSEKQWRIQLYAQIPGRVTVDADPAGSCAVMCPPRAARAVMANRMRAPPAGVTR